MFNEKIINWIEKNIKIADINKKIKCFEMALEISEEYEKIANLKDKILIQLDAIATDPSRFEIEVLSKVNQFLEIFIYLKDPAQYNIIGKSTDSANIAEYLFTLGLINEIEKKK